MNILKIFTLKFPSLCQVGMGILRWIRKYFQLSKKHFNECFEYDFNVFY